MGFTGLIFVVIAAAWLVYLVPLFLSRHDNGLLDEVEPGEPFTSTVTIVRRGTKVDTAEQGTAVISTPLNRRAALRELDLLDRRAALRRRVVLLVLLVTLLGVGVAVGLNALPWWSALIPAGLVAAFLVVARVTVKRMRADLARRAEKIRSGEDATEETVGIATLASAEEPDAVDDGTIDLTAPVEVTASLWDPVPIPTPTYVQKPLAPRTVRTIDLSAPGTAGSGVPVTADAPESVATPEDPEQFGGPRVVNG
ncbi:divisome protein SepX/GlpR [Nigerium massiliense]|uniref:divisome protein SepX/GlpR n=1 Tax=Nigerium massiliense TaxID=1522317 RepID=UPI000694EEB3|nr:hypothetical protein [Nigerium massiliense]